MSIGMNALRGVVDTGSLTLFRVTKKEWFVEDEIELYEFIKQHSGRYGKIPDIKTLKENGFVLPKIKQPPQYYIDRLTDRAIYGAVNALHKDYTDAMRSKDVKEITLALRAMVEATRQIGHRQDYSTLAENAALILNEYREAQRKPGLQGITTGYEILDEVTNGLQGGDVLVIGGRPNVGKSYKLLTMAKAAWGAGHPAAVCSMEMTSKNLARRLLGMEAGINPDLIRRGELSSIIGEPKLLTTIRDFQGRAPLRFMEGKFRKTTGDVRTMFQEFAPDIGYIDAGYLLSPVAAMKNYSKHDFISAVMEEIKCIAEDLSIPIVMTVQLNRQAKANSKTGPGLENIAGTDAIAQIATAVVGMVPGKVPYEETRREYHLMKNREGRLITYQGNFNFNPMNFDYLPGTEAVDDGEAVSEEVMQNELDAMADAGWER